MRLLWCVTLSLVTMVISEACQPGTDRRRYCSFSPEARVVMNKWLQKRGLESYFTRENVTVVTDARLGTAGKLHDIEQLVMRVPATVWYTYRNRLLRNSAYTIIAQTIGKAGLGAITGFSGAGAVKGSELGLAGALWGAATGAVIMGAHGAASSINNMLDGAEIGRSDYEEQLKSRAPKDTSNTIMLNLRGLILYASFRGHNDCMRIATSTDEDRLFLSYTDKAPRIRLGIMNTEEQE